MPVNNLCDQIHLVAMAVDEPSGVVAGVHVVRLDRGVLLAITGLSPLGSRCQLRRVPLCRESTPRRGKGH